MLRYAAAFLLCTPALAQETDISARIAEAGLSAVEAELAALPDPTDTERFALGGVRFLGAIERTVQTRWRVGADDRFAMIPILRLPVPPNPDPEPFEGAVIEGLFEDVLADMGGAREALAPIGDGSDMRLPIRLSDLWFDVDADGAREPGEGLLEVAGALLALPPAEGAPDPAIVFDAADAAWLAAYAHLLSAVSEMVLSTGPAEQIDRVIGARRDLAGLAPDTPYASPFDEMGGLDVDRIAMILMSLDGVPDAARTAAARDHLLEMIAQNRTLWARVAAETDDEGEWIPNAEQTQALGIPVPPDTRPVWLAVLDDAEALLTGERLIPYWRTRSGAGLDLAALLTDPPDMNVVGLIQGHALLPYAREGTRVSTESWNRFTRMTGGRGVLFAAFLN